MRVIYTDAAQVFVCERCSAAILEPASGRPHFLSGSDAILTDGRRALEYPNEFLDEIISGLPEEFRQVKDPLIRGMAEPTARAIAIGLILGLAYYGRNEPNAEQETARSPSIQLLLGALESLATPGSS